MDIYIDINQTEINTLSKLVTAQVSNKLYEINQYFLGAYFILMIIILYEGYMEYIVKDKEMLEKVFKYAYLIKVFLGVWVFYWIIHNYYYGLYKQ